MTPHQMDEVIGKALKKCVKEGDCLIYTGSHDQFGFARAFTPDGVRALHRQVYIQHYGEPGVGMLVYHTCGNRNCLNQDHLYIASAQTPQARSREESAKVLRKMANAKNLQNQLLSGGRFL